MLRIWGGTTPRASKETQVGLVDQCRRVERLARLLINHFLGGQPSQLIVNQGDQCIRCVGVALFDSVQDLSHIVHIPEDNEPKDGKQSLQARKGSNPGKVGCFSLPCRA
jgi:hypothetical protein